jgi:hypothetical protein
MADKMWLKLYKARNFCHQIPLQDMSAFQKLIRFYDKTDQIPVS